MIVRPARGSVSAPLLLSRCAADVTLDGGIAGSSSCACSSVTPRPCSAIAAYTAELMHMGAILAQGNTEGKGASVPA
jgi:hypothetical protein